MPPLGEPASTWLTEGNVHFGGRLSGSWSGGCPLWLPTDNVFLPCRELKLLASLVILCWIAPVTHQEDDVSDQNLEEVDVKLNQTGPDSDWSQVVKYPEERIERIGSVNGEEEVQEEEVDVSGKPRIIKRQIIKIPSGVTKVKVIAPKPMNQIRPKRMPPANRVYGTRQRKRPPRRYAHKRPAVDSEEEYEEPKHVRSRDVEGRRGMKKSKIIVKEVSPEEFFKDDEIQNLSESTIDNYQASSKHSRKAHSRKPQRYAHSEEVLEQRPTRRPGFEQETGYETLSQETEYSRPVKHHLAPEYEYSASSLYMKQVPAPNLTGLNIIDPPDVTKDFRAGKERAIVEGKKSPSSREIHPNFPHQYTSHNPYVVTNFGLDDKNKPKTYSSYHDDKSFNSFAAGSSKYNLQVAASSEQNGVTVPAGSNGLQVVQAPQLGTGAQNPEPPRTNQRATIRDILQEDCPDYEVLGYCSSPPRYPTIQIANMAMKCVELQEVMNSPVPAEPQDDLTSFSRRSDDDIDIIFDDESNNTKLYDFPEQSWSRSGTETETACNSDYTIIEPGYAREVTTGRWFVIVQKSDSSLQKVTTDTCSNPGKPCGGLSGMKCSRNRGFYTGIKSTRCIQRYTHQRLISWDPESPTECPKIRVFRFPTACVCHLKLM